MSLSFFSLDEAIWGLSSISFGCRWLSKSFASSMLRGLFGLLPITSFAFSDSCAIELGLLIWSYCKELGGYCIYEASFSPLMFSLKSFFILRPTRNCLCTLKSRIWWWRVLLDTLPPSEDCCREKSFLWLRRWVRAVKLSSRSWLVDGSPLLLTRQPPPRGMEKVFTCRAALLPLELRLVSEGAAILSPVMLMSYLDLLLSSFGSLLLLYSGFNSDPSCSAALDAETLPIASGFKWKKFRYGNCLLFWFSRWRGDPMRIVLLPVVKIKLS